MKHIIFAFLLLCSSLAADDQVALHEQKLFVSLGSHCDPARILQNAGLRKAAFPFDSIISMNGEAVLEMIETEFCYFLDERYLSPYPVGGDPLVHMRYHLEFLHDGRWLDNNLRENMLKLKAKYQRRIDRFNNLGSFPGTVYFIRSSYLHSLTDPHRIYKIAENREITEEYALRLYSVLKKRFPGLKFHVLIVNTHDKKEIEVEKRVNDNIMMIRANPSLDRLEKAQKFKNFYLGL
jgi:hypothetical protein